MDSYIVALYSGFIFLWQSALLLSTSFLFALLILSEERQTGGKLPASCHPDEKVQFRRIAVVMGISEHTNDIARYISGIPGVQEILLMRIHQTDKGYPRIEPKPAGYEQTPPSKNDAYLTLKEYFSALGMTARIAILSIPSRHASLRILKSAARWQGSLLIVDQENIPLIREMWDNSSRRDPGKYPSLPVLIIRSGEITRFLHTDSIFQKVLIPLHDSMDFNHVLNFIRNLPGNKEVVLVYFSPPDTPAEKASTHLDGIASPANRLTDSLYQSGRTVTHLISTGSPEEEICVMAEKHRVSLVAVMDGGRGLADSNRSGSMTAVIPINCLVPVLVTPDGSWVSDMGHGTAAGGETGYGRNSTKRGTVYD